MPTITTPVTFCAQCGRPRPADGASHCPTCHPAATAPPPPLEPLTPPTRRTLLDLLLDPRSIHWLLGSGGVLLAAGLVVWLASLGLFQNPAVVAAAMAAGTVGLLAAGWSTIRFTRYQLAGRAMTLLACLVMPLNLWFYQAHDLVTLEGHLWIAGVVCCALYAASAWRLKDPLFVYVLHGGVAMTGLLMLADMHRFAEIAAPSTLLMVLGLIALHAERLFPSREQGGDGDSAFSRQRFGRAFFWSAQALLASGLLLLLGAQLSHYIPFVHIATPDIVTNPAQRWWALALVAAGTYAYVYSDLAVRRVGTYLYVAAATVLWGEVLAIDLFHLSAQPAALITALALTALTANLLQAVLSRRFLNSDAVRTDGAPITIPGAHLAVLNMIPVIYGAFTYFRGAHSIFYALAMLTAAACCRIGAHLARTTSPRAAVANLYAGAASGLIGASSLLTLLGLDTLTLQAPILMLVPIGFQVAARAYRDNALAPTFDRIGQFLAGSLIALTIAASAGHHLHPTLFGPGTRPASTLAPAIVFAEAALFYTLAALLRGRPRNVHLATATAVASLYQLLALTTAATTITYTLAFAALGLAMLAVMRVFTSIRNPQDASPLIRATLTSANALTTLSFLSATLITLSHLAFRDPTRTDALQLFALGALGGLAALLAGHPGWRRGYTTAAASLAALAAITLSRTLNLTPWQRAEHLAVAAGLFLLALGHLGWHREETGRRNRSDTVTTQLLLGSLLAGVPLAIAAAHARYTGVISLPHEFVLTTVGILLLVTGNVFRIRSTTLTGGTLLALQLAMMLIFLGVRAQLALGVYLTIGGAAVFTTGLLLSIHRDRLATLPDRIRNHQGIFKILTWR